MQALFAQATYLDPRVKDFAYLKNECKNEHRQGRYQAHGQVMNASDFSLQSGKDKDVQESPAKKARGEMHLLALLGSDNEDYEATPTYDNDDARLRTKIRIHFRQLIIYRPIKTD